MLLENLYTERTTAARIASTSEQKSTTPAKSLPAIPVLQHKQASDSSEVSMDSWLTPETPTNALFAEKSSEPVDIKTAKPFQLKSESVRNSHNKSKPLIGKFNPIQMAGNTPKISEPVKTNNNVAQLVHKLLPRATPATALTQMIIDANRQILPWLRDAAFEGEMYSDKAVGLRQNFINGLAYYEKQAAAPTEPIATLQLTLSNLINFTIKSLNKEIDTAAKVAAMTMPEDYVSPYTALIGRFDKGLNGAVARVESNFVVVVEHYQLKHNPDIGILQAGGPFAGSKGSQLAGGWDAHVSVFSVAILAAAKRAIGGLAGTPAKPVILPKQRLGDIDAYITIVKDKHDWVINYHGNPPG